MLKEWGCDFYQGFLGSPPLTQDELTRFAAASLGRDQFLLLASRSDPRQAARQLHRAIEPRVGVGQSRETVILLSGLSFAAPFRRSM